MWLGTVFCHPERSVSLWNKSSIKKNRLIIQVVQESTSNIIIAYDQGKQKNVTYTNILLSLNQGYQNYECTYKGTLFIQSDIY